MFVSAEASFSPLIAFRPGDGATPRGEDLAPEDPNFDSDRASLGSGRHLTVVDVRAKGVKGNAPLAVPLDPRDIGAAEAAAGLDTDALDAELHRRRDRLLHGAAEGDTALELRGDVFADELGVRLGTTHLLDVDEELALGELLELGLELLDAGATLADKDTGARGVNHDLDLVRGALDLDIRDPRVRELLVDVRLELQVFVKPGSVVLILVPLGFPSRRDTEAEAVRVNFLSHRSNLFPSAIGDDDGEMAHAFLDSARASLGARPPATHVLVGRFIREGATDHELVEIGLLIFILKVCDRAREQFLDDRRRRLVGEAQLVERQGHVLPPNHVEDNARFTH